MSRIKTLSTALAATLGVAFAAPAVEAHITDTPYGAAAKIGNAYNGHCGNGWAWKCWAWPSYWDAVQVGAHSLKATWQWYEVYLPSQNFRYCAVTGRVEHGAFVQTYEGEHCWG